MKYPLVGAMREELLGISRGKDAKDVDWEKVAATFEDKPVNLLNNIFLKNLFILFKYFAEQTSCNQN